MPLGVPVNAPRARARARETQRPGGETNTTVKAGGRNVVLLAWPLFCDKLLILDRSNLVQPGFLSGTMLNRPNDAKRAENQKEEAESELAIVRVLVVVFCTSFLEWVIRIRSLHTLAHC